MKKRFTWAAILFVCAMPILVRGGDPPDGQCHYMLYCLQGPGTGGEMGPTPVWCPNPSVIGMDRCYAHWGVPQPPSNCD